ncbi:MAG: hypothetical protein ABIH36_01885 [bacterium]
MVEFIQSIDKYLESHSWLGPSLALLVPMVLIFLILGLLFFLDEHVYRWLGLHGRCAKCEVKLRSWIHRNQEEISRHHVVSEDDGGLSINPREWDNVYYRVTETCPGCGYKEVWKRGERQNYIY